MSAEIKVEAQRYYQRLFVIYNEVKKIFKNFNKNLAITTIKRHGGDGDNNQITGLAQSEPIIHVFNKISLN